MSSRRKRSPLVWVIPERVAKKDYILPGVGIKELGMIGGLAVLGFLVGSVLKTFVPPGIMGSIVGIGLPVLSGGIMYLLVIPNQAFRENLLTINRRKKAYKKKTLVYFYQRRR